MPLRSAAVAVAGAAVALLSGCGSAAPSARLSPEDRAALLAEIPGAGVSPGEAGTRLSRFRKDVSQLAARHHLAGADARVLDRIAAQAAAKVRPAATTSTSTSPPASATPPPVRTVTVTTPAPAPAPASAPPAKPPKGHGKPPGGHGAAHGPDKKKKDHGGD